MKQTSVAAEKYAFELKYDEKGLLPAVIQDVKGVVLMLAYMDAEAVKRTLISGQMWYYSRSRSQYWLKGETSGHFQEVVDVFRDCDKDTLLFTVNQTGWACHEDYYTCFHYQLNEDGNETISGEQCEEES